MNCDESKLISTKTRVRNSESILKDGFMNGAADGRQSTYQASFDVGYEQGLQFGIDIGFKDAQMYHSKTERTYQRTNQNMNCQICANTELLQQNIVNLYNLQKESNEQYSSKQNNGEK